MSKLSKLGNWFCIVMACYFGYLTFNYAVNDVILSKFNTVLFGVYTTIIMFSFAASQLLLDGIKKRMQRKANDKLHEIIDPINKNINLTDQEKKERIEMALQREINKMLKQQLGESK